MCKKKNKNYCPYCSSESGILPIVNGVNRLIKNIHYSEKEDKPEVVKVLCSSIIATENKGANVIEIV